MKVTSVEQFDDAMVILNDARENLVRGAKSTGNLITSYASALCMMFDVRDDKGVRLTAWYELKGKDKTGVKGEREQFAKQMTEAGFGKGTIDVYWQRVKEASGYVTAGNRVAGATSVDDKTLTELKTIINRIFKAEEAGDSTCDKASEIKGALIECFQVLWGDIDTLG